MKSSGTRKRTATPKAAAATTTADAPSVLIDARIRELGDWRGQALSALRTLGPCAEHRRSFAPVRDACGPGFAGPTTPLWSDDDTAVPGAGG